MPSQEGSQQDVQKESIPDGGPNLSEVMKPGKSTSDDVGVGSYGDPRKPFKGI